MTPAYNLPIAVTRWPVPRPGFHWQDGSANPKYVGDTVLVPVDTGPIRWTDPAVEQPGLYRVFADTPLTRDGIRQFASAHGTLGMVLDVLGNYQDREWDSHGYDLRNVRPLDAVVGLEPEDGEFLDEAAEQFPALDAHGTRAARTAQERNAEQDLRYGDTLKAWVEQLKRMKYAVAALDRVRSGTAMPAEAEKVRAIANEALGGQDVRVVLAKTRTLSRRRTVGAARRQPGGRLTLQIQPVNLVALMWVQFALAITGGRDHRCCGGCARWFEVSPEHEHGKRRYCSDACKARGYRLRKARAKVLAGDGVEPRQIAKVLGSIMKKVRGWVK